MRDFLEHQPWQLLLKASWQGAVLIVLVLAAQFALGKRLPPRWRSGLWLLVVLRLSMPWTVPSALSLFNFLNFSTVSRAIVRLPVTTSAVNSARLLPADSATASGPAQQAAEASTGSAPKFQLNGSWLPLAWAAGAVAMALFLLITHYRLSRRITPCRSLIDSEVLNLLEDCKQLMGVHVPVALVETAAVDGPCLFGFLRPRLLLPPGFTRDFSADELRHVFLHELGHVKRHDIPLGWLMSLLQILHWFNPLVWLAFFRMRIDRELACDALALSHGKDQDNKSYGLTIVKLLENFGDSVRAPSLAGIVEDKQQMKERIRMIAQFHKSNRGFAVAATVFAAFALLTLTDAQVASKSFASDTTGHASPPRIVSTSPVVAATEVDPALTEMTVTFDQDMQGGFSWTGGGPEFPSAPEGVKAHWRDKRTCVLPVKLEASHYYRVGVNSSSYKNFRSAAGVAALPSAIFFTTQGASEDLKAKTRVPQVVRYEPDNGAQNVSPEVAELRVTFSVPMGRGCSWCTSSDDGADFPKGREGKQRYWTEDKRTCVLPVELKPGMTYRVNLNAPGYRNFQSDVGVPLEPVLYTFKTSGDEKPEPQAVKIGEPDASKGVWVVRFEPVGDFTPRTPGEFLERTHQSGAYSGRKGEIGYFRTKKQGKKLVASFLAYDPEQLKAALDKVPGLKVTSVEKLTQEQLLDYEKSPQESLIDLDNLDASKGVWAVRFEPVGNFSPRTPGEFLDRIHIYSGQQGEIGYFRTTKQGDKLAGSFLAYDGDQLKAALNQVPGLKVTSVEKLTQEQLLDYEKSPQESL